MSLYILDPKLCIQSHEAEQRLTMPTLQYDSMFLIGVPAMCHFSWCILLSSPFQLQDRMSYARASYTNTWSMPQLQWCNSMPGANEMQHLGVKVFQNKVGPCILKYRLIVQTSRVRAWAITSIPLNVRRLPWEFQDILPSTTNHKGSDYTSFNTCSKYEQSNVTFVTNCLLWRILWPHPAWWSTLFAWVYQYWHTRALLKQTLCWGSCACRPNCVQSLWMAKVALTVRILFIVCFRWLRRHSDLGLCLLSQANQPGTFVCQNACNNQHGIFVDTNDMHHSQVYDHDPASCYTRLQCVIFGN